MRKTIIRLHHCAQTRSMRVLWLLNEIGVPFEVVRHSFDKALRAPEYLALSPAGRVPALEIDTSESGSGTGPCVLFESGAIIEYLCERFAYAGLGRAPASPGHENRTRIDWLIWLHFAETISQHAAALTQQHIVLYDDTMRSPVLMKIEAARLGKCYAALDLHLDGRAYLLNDGFSAVDVAVGQAVYMANHFAHIAPFVNLLRWYKGITARPGFLAALPQPDEARLYAQDFYEVWNG